MSVNNKKRRIATNQGKLSFGNSSSCGEVKEGLLTFGSEQRVVVKLWNGVAPVKSNSH